MTRPMFSQNHDFLEKQSKRQFFTPILILAGFKKNMFPLHKKIDIFLKGVYQIVKQVVVILCSEDTKVKQKHPKFQEFLDFGFESYWFQPCYFSRTASILFFSFCFRQTTLNLSLDTSRFSCRFLFLTKQLEETCNLARTSFFFLRLKYSGLLLTED